MWRFIVVTFAFMGWAFYVLSGGADYKPGENSIQARAKLDALRPMARPEKLEIAALAPVDATGSANDATRAITSLNDLATSDGNRFQITLASVAGQDGVGAAAATDPAKVDTLTSAVQAETAAAVEAALNLTLTEETAAAPEPEPDVSVDIRKVTGNLVNMRDGPGTSFGKVGKLRKGAEVAVLYDGGEGWLEVEVIETGATGWMADWLVTAAAN